MTSKIIHIFNPEADYSLAEFRAGYTPPASVIKLRRSLAHTPLRYADPENDIVLLLDEIDSTELYTKLSPTCDSSTRLPEIIPPSGHTDFFRRISRDASIFEIRPWGWTPDLRHILKSAGAPEELLPDDTVLINIRRLAHRTQTIRFNAYLNDSLLAEGISHRNISPIPVEIKSLEEGMDFIGVHKDVFFKYPWSSSGRGILHVDESASLCKVEKWIAGGLRRQGSLLAETTFDKTIDFATEWHLSNGTPEFLGLSVFNADINGNYMNNTIAPQKQLRNKIQSVCPEFNENYIRAQSEAIERITNGYTGYLGIDMMGGADGSTRGCVELNFRMTMGIAALLEESKL
ncbi:MAG: hypothetical protein K2H35_00230 [Muribaculaceae bacterium]|nr:hypothetical protein [Muribaculaceae bacterium]